ncbi:MAG TPA: 16S rRNA (guanine(966)-N(2))-methyltransferase RsmD [Elusimicrobia bacterium]|jgi:16S rRNA (guanine(966)-N(2))-methyltransferase RsmD|nr:16S rRNA (guanine(966)-N(2))-methyltransferase RsmD [Elusimicrobiota bacterium]
MSIRIIAGEIKGRKIKSVKGRTVRPLLARVKKSLFDIISRKIKDALFLDLYAGTGSVGIEALSRGAKEVVFIDNDSQAVEIIEENLKQFGFEGRAEIIRKDVLRGLPVEKKFDLIFIGPPYKLELILPTLKVISEKNSFAPDGWIICQHHFKEKLPEEYFSPASSSGGYELFRREKYGDTILSFYRMKRIDNEKIGLTGSD